MARVKVNPDTGLEHALRQFKRLCEREGIRKSLREREHYTPPSVKKKLKRKELMRKLRRRKRRRDA